MIDEKEKYLARIAELESQVLGLEKDLIHEGRWWSIQELQATGICHPIINRYLENNK